MKYDDCHNKPVISIVIPVYNRQDIVRATLDSVSKQTYRPFNIILVDNNSTDNTLEVLEKWKKQVENSNTGKGLNIIIAQCQKKGAAAARNKGLELTDTPWVMFFDSDDTMSPDHLKIAVDDIIDNPSANIIGWNTNHYRSGKLIHISRFKLSDLQWNNLFHGTFSTQHYCIRTDIIKKINGWNERVAYWDDIELGARLISLNINVCISKFPDNRVFINTSGDSITATPATDPVRITPALTSIYKTTNKKSWILLKAVIEAAICSKAKSPKGELLYRNTLTYCDNIFEKIKLKFAYHYTRSGCRGIARIYHFIKIV